MKNGRCPCERRVMSKIIATCAIRGAREIYAQAEEFLENSIREKGESCEVKFPDTAFYFPMAYALLGEEVKKLSDAKRVLLSAKALLHEDPSEKIWLPYLGNTLDSGVRRLFCEEII